MFLQYNIYVFILGPDEPHVHQVLGKKQNVNYILGNNVVLVFKINPYIKVP